MIYFCRKIYMTSNGDATTMIPAQRTGQLLKCCPKNIYSPEVIGRIFLLVRKRYGLIKSFQQARDVNIPTVAIAGLRRGNTI